MRALELDTTGPNDIYWLRAGVDAARALTKARDAAYRWIGELGD